MSVAAVGQPLDRADGRLKITGEAKYAADYAPKDLAYAAIVQSTVANGKIVKIDTTEAQKAPGFLGVITRENAPKLKKPKNDFGTSTKLGEDRELFADDKIHYAGQYLAIVIADSLERAEKAAALVRVEIDEKDPVVSMDQGGKTFSPADDFARTKYSRGDVEKALEGAAHVLRQTYSTPVEHHNPMEPSASIAVWAGERLTMYESTQWIVGARNVMADTLGLPREDVHIISNFVGGGFGCKGFVWPHSISAAIAAKHVGRPVKVALTRAQMFTSVGHRGATRQEVAMGLDAAAKLVAIQHETLTDASTVDDFIERCGVTTGFLYDCANISVKHQGARLNVATPTPMRAPGESPGLFAIESALDELAWELKICPVELRLKNYSEKDQEKGLPYSSKHLRECYEIGKKKLGWRRQDAPGSHREGRFLIGQGMATATYPGYRSPGAARVRILADGRVVVGSATQDIGTGTYTTLAQVAADALGMSPKYIRVELGDSSLPPAPVSGGSMTSASVPPAVLQAAEEVLAKLKKCAVEDPASPLHGLKLDEIAAVDGMLKSKSASVTFGEVLRGANVGMIEAVANTMPNLAGMAQYSMHSFGAQFSEVQVDRDSGEVRVRKHVAVFDVGRVINPKTARSQAMGGIIQGIGMALLEHTVYDRVHGRVITNNLADYAVPVNADIRELDVNFVDHPDMIISPVGARGVGEIGITGVAPAIANAIFDATGIRVRDLPITPDKLISQLQ